jgi:hypothetical protein
MIMCEVCVGASGGLVDKTEDVFQPRSRGNPLSCLIRPTWRSTQMCRENSATLGRDEGTQKRNVLQVRPRCLRVGMTDDVYIVVVGGESDVRYLIGVGSSSNQRQ